MERTLAGVYETARGRALLLARVAHCPDRWMAARSPHPRKVELQRKLDDFIVDQLRDR